MQVDFKTLQQNTAQSLEFAFLNREQTSPGNAIQYFETTTYEEQA